MESSILVALSRQDALERHLSVVANNMANMNTTAFKAEHIMLVDHPVRVPAAGADEKGGIAFVRDVGTLRDTTDGPLNETSGDLDVAISGEGYFVVSTPMGDRYTRDGHLRLDQSGQLVTDHGLPVLTQGGAPVRLGPQDGQVVIARDGSIASEAGPLGRLRVVRFAHPEKMEAVAGGLMTSEEPPEDVAAPIVLQGMLESSNVQPITEMTHLIGVQRAYDQARSLIDKEDERIKKSLQAYLA